MGSTVEACGHLDKLLDSLFLSTGVQGVHARTGLYEEVVAALGRLISGARPSGAEVLSFPPVMSRAHIERQGYLKSFPNLLGVVSCLCGDERHIRKMVEGADNGSGWVESLSPTELVLSPAACYPVYPLVAARGDLPADGLVFDVSSDCFRREPSEDIDRLQSFRMREFVRIGSPDQALQFRNVWIDKALELSGQLDLPSRVATASDPFFGRGGELVARSQIEQELKFELLVPIRSAASPTACMSFNYHQDHFGLTWGMKRSTGQTAHSACVAFGLDRLGVALFAVHGLDVARWPAGLRSALGL